MGTNPICFLSSVGVAATAHSARFVKGEAPKIFLFLAAADAYGNVTATAIITVPAGGCFSCSVRYVDATTDDAATTPTPVIEVQNANVVVNRIA